jgi:crossover junction endodeoxyribonuclease RuvC
MFERVVLGVDPGTSAVGLAIVTGTGGRPDVRWTTTVRTDSGSAPAVRLRQIARAVRAAIVEHRPESLAIERLIWNKNVGSAMEVARASGAIMAAAAEAGVHVEEYAPLEVKMAVTGVGNASKDQVRRGLGLLLGAANVPAQPDAADAVAVAVCHLQQSKLRRLTREATGR